MKYQVVWFFIVFYVFGSQVACGMQSDASEISWKTRFENLSHQFKIVHNRSSRLLEQKRSENQALKIQSDRQMREIHNLHEKNAYLQHENTELQRTVQSLQLRHEKDQTDLIDLYTKAVVIQEVAKGFRQQWHTEQENHKATKDKLTQALLEKIKMETALHTEQNHHKDALARNDRLRLENGNLHAICLQQKQQAQRFLNF